MDKNASLKAVAIGTIAFGIVLLTIFTTTNHSILNVGAQSVNTTKDIDSYTLEGQISSVVFVPGNDTESQNYNITELLNSMSKFILSGNWSLSLDNGEVTDFKAFFIKVLANGNKHHTHDLINFEQDNKTQIQIKGNNSLSVKGVVDIKLNNNTPWNNTNVNIDIEKDNTIAIKLDNNQTSNHFEGQKIYGIVTSIKNSTS
ncbi:hypothetical protein [Candidatus Nitrosocosmicus hydrocola]|uniref:hypothetical protein n=1 Tax=Candidatus Nitrosocosmicus hydrocola TaxID=1826872 RepID=UPI0011E5DC93|nr:hypothetical protein [Candidatus Nitrosocosmicus hydrocola]